ncbi:hypothetical protein, partial [Staphylococcus auricularis]|uniref:hypothetical protein n=1 Tax=Staphylococcus auricularis TaxID=29379 RepID=UPI001CD94F52
CKNLINSLLSLHVIVKKSSFNTYHPTLHLIYISLIPLTLLFLIHYQISSILHHMISQHNTTSTIQATKLPNFPILFNHLTFNPSLILLIQSLNILITLNISSPFLNTYPNLNHNFPTYPITNL